MPMSQSKRIIKGIEYDTSDIVKINGRYYPKSDERVIFCIDTNSYQLRNANHRFGIWIDDALNASSGIFTVTDQATVVIDDNSYILEDADHELCQKFNNNSNAVVVNDELKLLKLYGKVINPDPVSDIYYFNRDFPKVNTTNFPYNVDTNNIKNTQIRHDSFISRYDNVNLDKFTKFLNYSIGVEYETSKGYLTNSLCDSLGIVKLRDGSLDGGVEYSTIPMSGRDAIISNILIPKVLRSFKHGIDITCSLHVHLGGYPIDKESICLLWLLLDRLQFKIADFICPYRKTKAFVEKVFMKEGKDYCAPLPSDRVSSKELFRHYRQGANEAYEQEVKNQFSNIFTFLTNGVRECSDYNLSNRKHPANKKWDQISRYSNMNVLPLVFGNSRTFESRLHTATLNPYKIFNWIFINNAILKFAENNKERILSRDKIDMEDILSVYLDGSVEGETLYTYLQRYIMERKSTFENFFVKKHKYYPHDMEIEGDYNYIPKYVPDSIKAIFSQIK
jgi:hypothetical protein